MANNSTNNMANNSTNNMANNSTNNMANNSTNNMASQKPDDQYEYKKECLLRSGDNKIVKFTFAYHPEFIEENMIFFFRDGTTKGVGEVLRITDNIDGLNII
jgi:hypothetical protein